MTNSQHIVPTPVKLSPKTGTTEDRAKVELAERTIAAYLNSEADGVTTLARMLQLFAKG
tara:strand:- start:38118 stop:38294 length:177 start_codon:yes stop_codon:yes gene_type:complete